MKIPKSSSEEHRKKMIDILNKSDLTKSTMSVDKLKEYRQLMLNGDCAAADDLYIHIVFRALNKDRREIFYSDVVKSRHIAKGKNRGKQKTKEASKINEWLYPLLAECEAEFSPERKNRGWKSLRDKAMKKITKNDLDDPRKKSLTRYRIQAWIDKGRPKY